MIKSGFYTIPASQAFADNLVTGIIDKFPEPEQLARIELYLPSRRAISSIKEAFFKHQNQGPILLPKMFAVGEPDEEVAINIAIERLELDEAINGFERQCLIASQIQHFPIGGRRIAPAPAMKLASSLCMLIDQMQRAGTPLSAIKDVLPDELSTHWQEILKFLTILFDYWPSILAERGQIDPVARQQQLLQAQLDFWTSHPPNAPIILAGSTGTLPMTRAFMKVISQLPMGVVIFPGIELDIEDADWCAIEQDPVHPLHQIARSMVEFELPLSEVRYWHVTEQMQHKSVRSRQIVLRELMRPASRTSQWRRLAVDQSELSPSSLEGLKVMSVTDAFQEAELIAGLMRQALETPNKTAMLITPDRMLARKVQAALTRWNILVDDSAGSALILSSPARFLALIIRVVQEDASPHALRALFKHPFATAGLPRAEFIHLANLFEEQILRGPLPRKNWESWTLLVAQTPKLKNFWQTCLLPAFIPLRDAFKAINPSLDTLAIALMQTAQNLGALPENRLDENRVDSDSDINDTQSDAAFHIYSDFAGVILLELLSDMIRFGDSYPLAASEFYNTFSVLCQEKVVRTPYNQHPRLKILGTIEARMQQADTVILGGLNEGVWPPFSQRDMWINNASRTQLGLPDRHWRIALSAHDFMMAAASPEVMITRSVITDGAPTQISRWLARLDAVVAAAGLSSYLDKQIPVWMKAVNARKIPDIVKPIARPEPKPALAQRPSQISATDFDQWITDPYGFYVKKILKIRQKNPIDEPPSVALRGSLIHDVIAEFSTRYPTGKLPEDAGEQLHKIVDAHLSKWSNIAYIDLFWRQKISVILNWFLEEEGRRRDERFQVVVEKEGKLELSIGQRLILVTARADRIELHQGNHYKIIDYKSGNPPSKLAVSLGRAVQLLVEAAILSKGGYGLSDKTAQDIELFYWQLKGRETAPAKIDDVTPDDFDVSIIFDQLLALVQSFENEEQPYLSEPNSAQRPKFSQVRHLARIKEWRAFEVNDDG
jgi:ATP-dependent helicase/nuclease subunit B